MKRTNSEFRHAVSLTAVVLAVATGPGPVARAAWQPHHIKVGDGQGGVVTLPAKRQVITRSGGNYLVAYGLAQMDNGRVAMVASWHDGANERPVIAFSDDAGDTWSDFQMLPAVTLGSISRPMALTYLGRGNLSYVAGYERYFSSDYGQTFPEVVERQKINGNRDVGIEGSAGVDRDARGVATRVMEMVYYWPNGPMVGWPQSAAIDEYFSYSDDGGRTWQGYVMSPNWEYTETYKGTTYDRGVSEGAVIRAANGDLVAALRTDMPARFFVDPGGYDDSLEGTGVSISHDDGRTWSPVKTLFTAGRHHAALRRLPNGNLIMTMIVRDDVRSGDGYKGTPLSSPMRGMDAVISRDNGVSWNLDNRITLDEFEYYDPNKWYNGMTGHLGVTVLDDGSMLACYGKYTTGNPVMVKWNPAAVSRRLAAENVREEP